MKKLSWLKWEKNRYTHIIMIMLKTGFKIVLFLEYF